jgi:hypothetical protein
MDLLTVTVMIGAACGCAPALETITVNKTTAAKLTILFSRPRTKQ